MIETIKMQDDKSSAFTQSNSNVGGIMGQHEQCQELTFDDNHFSPVEQNTLKQNGYKSNKKDWESFLPVLKSVGPKLVPFLKTLGIYFVIFIPSDRPSWLGLILKILPIASLCLFVLLYGISLGNRHTFARRILAGLFFSLLGDAFLVWPEYFVEGMLAFGIAQVCYTYAFGFKPLNMTLGIFIYSLTFVGLAILMPHIDKPHLLIGVPFYTILLFTMLWRAIARVQPFEDLWTWTKICSCLGGIFFAISDTVLGFHLFYSEIPSSQAIIMVTYYIAQFGIALSVVTSKSDQQKNLLEQLHKIKSSLKSSKWLENSGVEVAAEEEEDNKTHFPLFKSILGFK